MSKYVFALVLGFITVSGASLAQDLDLPQLPKLPSEEPKLHQSQAPATATSTPRFFREIDPTRDAVGACNWQPVTVNGKSGLVPYFIDFKTGYGWRISDSDPNVEKAVNDCADGEVISISGEFVGQELKIKKFEIVSNETKKSKSGAVFTRVTPKQLKDPAYAKVIKNPFAFGEMWLDQYGVIWGDLLRDEKREVKGVSVADAKKLCAEIGGDVPTGQDYQNLVSMLTDRAAQTGFAAEILATLGAHSELVMDANQSYMFDSNNGRFARLPQTGNPALRCIIRTQSPKNQNNPQRPAQPANFPQGPFSSPFGGPQFGAPQFGGPQFGGAPQFGGPQFGGPQMQQPPFQR